MRVPFWPGGCSPLVVKEGQWPTKSSILWEPMESLLLVRQADVYTRHLFEGFASSTLAGSILEKEKRMSETMFMFAGGVVVLVLLLCVALTFGRSNHLPPAH